MNKLTLKQLQKICFENKIDYKVPRANNKGLKNDTKKNLIMKLTKQNINVVSIVDEEKVDEEKALVPLFKWSGGKKDEIKYFKKHFPDTFDTYLEPFFGGGAVFFNLKPKKAAVADVHKEAIDFYRTVKNKNMDKIKDFMDNHKNDSETYYKVREMDRGETPLNQIDNASRFFYLRKTTYRGMLRYNRKLEFNVPYGKYKTCDYSILENKEYEELFQNVDIHLGDFTYIFENYNDENNFMFLDPPYDTPFSNYGYGTFGKEEHIKLSECFKNTKIRCLMVISETPFIRELYNDYVVETFDKKYKFRLHSDRVTQDNIDKPHLIIKNF